MVRWLEYEQYDINYITNLDTHRKSNGFNLTETELFLSQGHDEYWTWEMRDNVERSRDQGVDLAFFASNAAYYQIRLEPASSGIVDRVMVAYKDTLLDPVFTDADPDNDHLTTIPFRYSPVARPEEALIGVQYILDPYDGDIIVTNPAHWVFYNTGLSIGSRLTGLLGYEPDGVFGGGPSNLEILAETPIVSPLDPTQTGTSHMTIYEANTFSSVFATGSLQWSWGLDDYNAPSLRTSRLSAQAQQITSNVLEVFGANPGVGAPVSAWCIRFVSHADANGGLTTSAAELDLRDEHGYSVTKTGWSLFDVSSEEQASADAAAAYAFDGNMETYWQTNRSGPGHPHEIQIHLGTQTEVTALHYTPGQNIGLDGAVIDYEIHVSESPLCDAWDIVASGTWESTSGRKIARFPD
jgi:hypothetical protein